jgi:hypothetical protein
MRFFGSFFACIKPKLFPDCGVLGDLFLLLIPPVIRISVPSAYSQHTHSFNPRGMRIRIVPMISKNITNSVDSHYMSSFILHAHF